MAAGFRDYRNGPLGGQSGGSYKVSTKCSHCLTWTDVSERAAGDPGQCKDCGRSLRDYKHGYIITIGEKNKGYGQTTEVWCEGVWIIIPNKKWWMFRDEKICQNCKKRI